MNKENNHDHHGAYQCKHPSTATCLAGLLGRLPMGDVT
jgi:hypothetical protein